ncbi:hypothetical protein [Mucilaginibacter polytrichastri]|uniref:Uncharacterized protein n=1 Tax=Mucilaginibacter polytrichastri TaxID=1302689 RepID=A0A1Q5ZYM9_9SPHI|nr:hypothetical protein [Mucilaginibacter polytrichastri]OKS86849.1 hypothetical protein RG47T_2306 [Mucilaginibacter polytrichastri]SFT17435.1 hypothetical protein SAMN04487890_11431 [Mucilaginibacter polytrichastri]
MKEIDAIVAKVKGALAAKKQEIINAGNSVIPFVTDAFKRRQMEVCSFELMNNQVNAEDYQKTDLIIRCEHDALDLLGEISKIRV